MLTEYDRARKCQIMKMLKCLALAAAPMQGENPTSVSSLYFFRHDAPEYTRHCLSLPMASMLLQGTKQVNLANSRFIIGEGQMLVTCVDIPSTSMLEDVSPERPFLAMGFLLDKKILAELLSEMPPESRPARQAGQNTWVMDPPGEFLETLLRLAELTTRPREAAILAPLILRELHYLLLSGPHGALLHELYMHGARDNRIIDAITWLKKNIGSTISVESLAKKVNMSVSSLHRHFKLITGYSPLQYHKKLRLYEAQRLMLAENERADIAALAVGYESITQFNREYKRMFGEPPHRDISRRKNMLRN